MAKAIKRRPRARARALPASVPIVNEFQTFDCVRAVDTKHVGTVLAVTRFWRGENRYLVRFRGPQSSDIPAERWLTQGQLSPAN